MIPAAAVELVKRFEGVRLEAYKCPSGVLTVGAGHTAAMGDPVPRLGMRITAEDADWILHRDLNTVAAQLRPLIDVELTDNQFGALVSWAFNCGVGAFERSTLRQIINAGQLAAVPNELLRWVKGGQPKRVLPGLVARREAEGKLWQQS